MKDIVCIQCKYVGTPKLQRRGSGKWEMMGWTLLFPLGVPYTIWRMMAHVEVCKHCRGTMLLEADSPAGQRMIKIAVGEKVYPEAPSMNNVGIPYGENMPSADIILSPVMPVMTMNTATPEPAQNPPHIPVREPGPAPKPIDDPAKPQQPSPPPVSPEPVPEEANGKPSRLNPDVW